MRKRARTATWSPCRLVGAHGRRSDDPLLLATCANLIGRTPETCVRISTGILTAALLGRCGPLDGRGDVCPTAPSHGRRRRTGFIEGTLPRLSELTTHRPRLQPEHVVQRATGLGQREVQRRRLERPVAKAQCHVPLRRLRPQLERAEMIAEARQRHSPSSGSEGRVSCNAVPSSRNTETSCPSPSAPAPHKPHLRRNALELVSEHGVQALVLASL